MQPSPSSPMYTDLCTTIATRLRLGLPPLDDMPETCPLCKEDVTATPWHALSCAKLKRETVTQRHDHCCQLLCRFARSNDCTAHVVQEDLAHLLPDGEIHMFCRTVDFDVSGVNPHTPSYVDMAPGEAMTRREKYKIGSMLPTLSSRAARSFPLCLTCMAAWPQLPSNSSKTSGTSRCPLSAPPIPSAFLAPPFLLSCHVPGSLTMQELLCSG